METRTIEGAEYSLVKKQRGGASIYRGIDTYLRIGPPEIVSRNLAVHREMERSGFPVPQVLSEGTNHGETYFIERSLGSERYADTFKRDMKAQGSITPEHFRGLVELARTFTEAQIRSPEVPYEEEDFFKAVHVETLCAELPQYAAMIRARTDMHMRALKPYPFRLMHGDLNAANMYPGGVIDFEDTAHGPVGFDAVSVIHTIEWFPIGPKFEFQGWYTFTDSQKADYLYTMNDCMRAHNLPPLSSALVDFEFFRSIWLTVRMHQWPILQKYRYDLFIDTYLK